MALYNLTLLCRTMFHEKKTGLILEILYNTIFPHIDKSFDNIKKQELSKIFFRLIGKLENLSNEDFFAH